MRKITSILTLFLVLLFSGCTQQKEINTDMTAVQIAEAIINECPELADLSTITLDDKDFSLWLSDFYNIPEEQITDGAICYANGARADEIVVLVLKDEQNAETVQTALTEYKESRIGAFEGYAPQEAGVVKNGIVTSNGKYVSLFICPDVSAADNAFLRCFGRSVTPTPEAESGSASSSRETPPTSTSEEASSSVSKVTETSNRYDHDAILEAWRSGDASGLSDMNREILAAAENIIKQGITDNMSDYEKELAVHDWITENSRFDYGVFGRSPSDGYADGSDTPYGVLINRSAMCHGYSSTFQLFMDMLNIECITVFGTPNSSGTQHSWNMVRLEDEWYCVDAAWDDPIGGSPCHTYFNVTSEFLRSRGIHKWDETSVPEAAADKYAYHRK